MGGSLGQLGFKATKVSSSPCDSSMNCLGSPFSIPTIPELLWDQGGQEDEGSHSDPTLQLLEFQLL